MLENGPTDDAQCVENDMQLDLYSIEKNQQDPLHITWRCDSSLGNRKDYIYLNRMLQAAACFNK